MGTFYLVRHPETIVNLAEPVHQWRLSPAGERQAASLARQPFWRQVAKLYCSQEFKALTTARVIAERNALAWQPVACLGELDRRSFQPADDAAYRQAVGEMFARPAISVAGWETREHAAARMVSCVEQLVGEAPGDDLAIISHGLVLTILVAHWEQLDDPLDLWRGMGFASVARVDTVRWRLLEPFKAGGEDIH